MERSARHKGFTLIELIAVMVILGLLAAVAVPRYQNLLEESKRAACKGGVVGGLSALTIAYGRLSADSPQLLTDLNNIVNDAIASGVAGDFTISYSVNNATTVTVTAARDGYNATGLWTIP